MNYLAEVWPLLPAAMFLGFLPDRGCVDAGPGSDPSIGSALCGGTFARPKVGFRGRLPRRVGTVQISDCIAPSGCSSCCGEDGAFPEDSPSRPQRLRRFQFGLSGLSQTRVYLRSPFLSEQRPARWGCQSAPLPGASGLYGKSSAGLVAGLTSRLLPDFSIQVVTVVLSGLVVIWCALQDSQKLGGADAFFIAIVAGTIVSYYLFIHDLSVLLLPLSS